MPKYDFNWQINYVPAEPKLPAQGHAWSSASATTTTRPITWPTPIQSEVPWGDQTWEEMINGFMEVAIDPKHPPAEIFGHAPGRDATVKTSAVAPAASTSTTRASAPRHATGGAPAPPTKVTYHKDVEPHPPEELPGLSPSR